jgi:hypothetical protein
LTAFNFIFSPQVKADEGSQLYFHGACKASNTVRFMAPIADISSRLVLLHVGQGTLIFGVMSVSAAAAFIATKDSSTVEGRVQNSIAAAATAGAISTALSIPVMTILVGSSVITDVVADAALKAGPVFRWGHVADFLGKFCNDPDSLIKP